MKSEFKFYSSIKEGKQSRDNPTFRETLRLDCFPNGPGVMLSFKQIFQTGSSLRMTFVGHKVNWGGPGPGTPLSSLWPQPDVRIWEWCTETFSCCRLFPLGDEPPPGSLSDRAIIRHREPSGAPCHKLECKQLLFRNELNEFNRSIHECYTLLQDGRQEPRGGRLDRRLPNPRAMSKKNHPDENKPDTRYTHMVMQFGQFLDHDLTLTPKDGKFWHTEGYPRAPDSSEGSIPIAIICRKMT